MNHTTRKALITGKSQEPQNRTKEKGEGNHKKRSPKKSNEEFGNDREKKIKAKVYDLNRDKEINGDFRTADHNNDRGNNNKDYTPRAKLRPLKNKNKNKTYSPTVKGKFLKATHNKESREEDKDETMDTRYNKK